MTDAIDTEKIKELISRYNQLKSSGKIADYNEERTKKDFILPLFQALGWKTDTDEVTAEETISKGRVDYGFYIDGIPKFYLEAKSLREKDIITEKYVKQAIDYAWMRSCTWSILTNFETLVIYNAEQKSTDPRMNRFLIFTNPEEYLEKTEFLLLSRESFRTGEIDKKATTVGKKDLKKPIDKALLDDITNFRENLYNNIRKNNKQKNLSEEDIEEAVQRIIDRLIFIRSAEDRSLEPEELRSKLREWSSSGKRSLLSSLAKVYGNYDENYNSKLFAKHLCDDLVIDNEILGEVIEGLYESKDGLYSYDFSLISADVLGNIYEQYLGRILKKVGKIDRLEASKSKRKSEGIYYTPTYIVDYIIKNTLGEYLKTHKEKDVENVKILDPACGSGSFLLKSYDTLENYWKEKGKLKQNKLEEYGSYSKKVDIAKNNIFGVDLDQKAVEIAQLNLLLKIAEKSKRLPILQNNIKCGNSLIDDTKIAGDKAFSWQEQFKEIINNGGFDIIVGNPPYVNVKDLSKKDLNFFKINYHIIGRPDLYILFLEKSLDLLKDGGRLSFISSNKFFTTKNGELLRKKLLTKFTIEKIVDCSSLRVFSEASVYPAVYVILKSALKNNKIQIAVVKKLEDFHDLNYQSINQEELVAKNIISTGLDTISLKIVEKMYKNSTPLGKILDIRNGIIVGDQKTLVVKENQVALNDKIFLKPVLGGKDVYKWRIHWGNNYIIYDKKRLIAPRNESFFKGEKIIMRDIGLSMCATLDDKDFYCLQTLNVAKPKIDVNIKFLLGILNSNLMNFFYIKNFGNVHVGGGYYRFRERYVQHYPIKLESSILSKTLASLVNLQLENSKKVTEIGENKTDKRTEFEDKIKRTDEEINEIVYKLYGITKEEKDLIEIEIK
jgi:methylase of polypeptide subunit release factors